MYIETASEVNTFSQKLIPSLTFIVCIYCDNIAAPNEVPLVVEGSNDPCSSGKDIYFQLVGFKLEGKVSLYMDIKFHTWSKCVFS